MPFKRKNQTEITVLSVVLIIAILLFSIRAYSIQVANSDKLAQKVDGAASVMTAVLKAPRGEILDCYGRRIAINRDGYNIVFNKAYIKDNFNDVVLALVNLLEKYSAEYNDLLPMAKTAPYNFLNDEERLKDIEKLKDLYENHDMSLKEIAEEMWCW